MARDPVLEIVDPGLLLSIQDGGRPGMRRRGRHAGRRRGPPLARRRQRARRQPAGRGGARGDPARADRAGARARSRSGSPGRWPGTVTETGERVVPGSTVTLRAGDTLALEPAIGARGYLAVPGGIDVPVVLGSRSTALGAGFGGLDGRALRAGDRLARGGGPGGPARALAGRAGPGRGLGDEPPSASSPARTPPTSAPIALDAFLATPWTVSPTSDRVGLRLDGDPIPGAPAAELASHGVVAGTIQLPPDRRPIVLLVDHQPTGGYPVLAVVITADLDRLGQLAPGATAWFERTTRDEARAALLAQDDAFAEALAQLRDAARWDDLWRGAGA